MDKNSKIYITGGGIAGLSVAAFAIRDANIPGNRITIFEETHINGGSLDGNNSPTAVDAFVTRGGRMLTDETYLCTWDLFSSIPSIDNVNKTVREEVVEFNKANPTHANARLINNKHEIMNSSLLEISMENKFSFLKLLSLSEEQLGTKRIDEIFDDSFFNSNFWKMWRTTFAFQKWHSAVELKRYFLRFIQEFPRIHTLEGVRRTKFNQYDSMVVPLQKWLLEKGVKVKFGTKVLDADFEIDQDGFRKCTKLYLSENYENKILELDDNDCTFLTLGSITSDSRFGDNNSIPELIRDRQDGGWSLWENISKKADDFGRPLSFYGNIDEHKWESFTITMNDDVLLKRIEKFSNNRPGTGALMTFYESGWHLSIVIPYQPHFANLPKNSFTLWGYGFQIDDKGNYINKKMSEATGNEIMTELLKHLGFDDLVKHATDKYKITTVMMPYASALFACREKRDRPLVIPDRSKNFAFLGQFVEIPDDVVFTVEYSVRAAMVGVYGLFNVNKEIPEIYKGILDPSVGLNAFKTMFN